MAVDVQYLASGGARAAAVVTADATFSRLVAERTELVPDVAPYRPGQFYLRELPPMRAVLDGLSEMTLLGRIASRTRSAAPTASHATACHGSRTHLKALVPEIQGFSRCTAAGEAARL